MSAPFHAPITPLNGRGVGSATSAMALEMLTPEVEGDCYRQAPKDANTRNRMQLDASPYAVSLVQERVASICIYLPEVKRQDVYCDITSLLSVPSQYPFTRLWLDADLLCEARSGDRRLGRAA